MSDAGVRSGYVVTALGALFLCGQPAFAQTRPILSEVFQSRVIIQITTGADVVEGEGELVYNQPAGQADEFYEFDDGSSSEIISRYDLGKIFTIDSTGCDVTTATGSLPLFWGWVANAKQGAGVVIDGVEYTTWVSTGTDERKTLAATNDGTIPAYYEDSTLDRTVRITFSKWKPTFKKNAVKPPHSCPQ